MLRLFLDQNGVLRSGWRAAGFLVAYMMIAYALIAVSIVILSQSELGETSANLLPISIPFAISTVVAVGMGWLCLRLFESLPVKALGVSFTGGWFAHLVGGLLIGTLAIGSAVLIALMGRGLELHVNILSSSSAIWTTLLVTAAVLAIGAASEETLFRGYFLQTLARGPVKWFAVVLTAALFALPHYGNPDASLFSMANTFLAGVWFAVAYLKTRDIWFPFGIHFIWNWLQGPVLGISVSGISGFSSDPVLRATDHGPAWLTGGTYGIEGGLACTIAIAISIGLVYFLPGPKPTEEMLNLTQTKQPSGS